MPNVYTHHLPPPCHTDMCCSPMQHSHDKPYRRCCHPLTSKMSSESGPRLGSVDHRWHFPNQPRRSRVRHVPTMSQIQLLIPTAHRFTSFLSTRICSKLLLEPRFNPSQTRHDPHWSEFEDECVIGVRFLMTYLPQLLPDFR